VCSFGCFELLLGVRQKLFVFRDQAYLSLGFFNFGLVIQKVCPQLLIFSPVPGNIEELIQVRQKRTRIVLRLYAGLGGFVLTVGFDRKYCPDLWGAKVFGLAVDTSADRMLDSRFVHPDQVDGIRPNLRVEQLD